MRLPWWSNGFSNTLLSNAGGNLLEEVEGRIGAAFYALNNVTVNLAAGSAKVNGTSVGDTLIGITAVSVHGSSETLIAGTGADTLWATGSHNTLLGGVGTTTMIQTGTTNFYDFAGQGQASIVNGTASSTTASNELDFGSGITDEQLWFLQSGNDLRIDVMGTSSEATVSNWFASTGNQLQEITAAGLKIDSQVAQLVQAMATYSSGHTGFDPTAVANSHAPNDSALQGVIAAAWHS